MKMQKQPLVLLLLLPCFQGALAQTDVLPRRTWRANEPKSADPGQYEPQKKILILSVHQTEYPDAADPRHKAFSESEQVNNVQSGHLDDHPRLGDIAYHYIVGMSGKIYKGRRNDIAPGSKTRYLSSDEQVGATWNRGRIIPAPNNVKSKGIPGATNGHITVSFLCKNVPLSDNAKTSGVRLMTQLLIRYGLTPNDIKFHREFAKSDCPGDEVYKWMRGSSMSVNEKGEGLNAIQQLYAQLKHSR
jgi:hypothetical protein